MGEQHGRPIDTSSLPLRGYNFDGRPMNIGQKVDEKLGRAFDPDDFSTYAQTGIESIGRSADRQMEMLMKNGIAKVDNPLGGDVSEINAVTRRTEVTKQEVEARRGEIEAKKTEIETKKGLRRKLAGPALHSLNQELAYLDAYDAKLPAHETIEAMGKHIREHHADELYDEAIMMAELEGKSIKKD